MLKNSNRGFTLVELIVSLGLFAFVMSISTGAYLIMIASNRQAQAVATGINNLSYALDAMTRNIRTGYNYACSDSNRTFAFDDAFGVPNVYRFVQVGAGYKITQTANGTSIDVTDQSVVLSSDSRFECRGVTKLDKEQINVVMIVSGTVASGPGKLVTINLQTMATRRGVDL